MSRPAVLVTADEIRAKGVRMDGAEAVQIVFGVGRTKSYELLRSGVDLGFRVLRVGRRYTVPTAEVLRVLGLDVAA